MCQLCSRSGLDLKGGLLDATRHISEIVENWKLYIIIAVQSQLVLGLLRITQKLIRVELDLKWTISV